MNSVSYNVDCDLSPLIFKPIFVYILKNEICRISYRQFVLAVSYCVY